MQAGIVTGGLLGGALLFVSEFTTLYNVQLTSSGAPIRSISTSSHDSYALIPIAIVVAVLTLDAKLLAAAFRFSQSGRWGWRRW